MPTDGSRYAAKPSAPNKLTDYATYDSDGGLLPLSQRLDYSVSDERYSITLPDTDTATAIDFKARVENIVRHADTLQNEARNDAEYAALDRVKKNAEKIAGKFADLDRLRAELKERK